MKNLEKYILNRTLFFLMMVIFTCTTPLLAQEEEGAATEDAVITLSFSQNDSMRICTAVVAAGNVPLPEKEVHFYVKRLYSLLPVGKAVETDSSGVAIASFPLDLPGDKNGNYTAVARMEDDDTYGTVETTAEVKWGVQPSAEHDHWGNRSLSAFRERAPAYLILVSNLIIAVIWGVLLYILFQVFRIKKAGRLQKK